MVQFKRQIAQTVHIYHSILSYKPKTKANQRSHFAHFFAQYSHLSGKVNEGMIPVPAGTTGVTRTSMYT